MRDIRGQLLEKIINESLGDYFAKFKVARYRREHIKGKKTNLKKYVGLEILCTNPRMENFQKLLSKKYEIKQKDLHKIFHYIIDVFNKSLFENLNGDFYCFLSKIRLLVEQEFIQKRFERGRDIQEDLVTRETYEFDFTVNIK